MWYRFEKDNPIGIPRVKQYQVAFYDMTKDGKCFDEDFFLPDEIDRVIPFVETVEDEGNADRTKVFVHFDNGDIYELKMEKVNQKRILSAEKGLTVGVLQTSNPATRNGQHPPL